MPFSPSESCPYRRSSQVVRFSRRFFIYVRFRNKINFADRSPNSTLRTGLALDRILPNRVAGPSCLTVLHVDLVSLTQTVRWSPQGWNPDRICPMQHRGPRSASPTHGPQTPRSPRRPDLHRQGLHRRRRPHLRRPQLESRRRRGRDCSNPVIPQVTEFGPRPREGSSDRELGSSGPPDSLDGTVAHPPDTTDHDHEGGLRCCWATSAALPLRATERAPIPSPTRSFEGKPARSGGAEPRPGRTVMRSPQTETWAG